jgi:DNA-binding MarR family transcriptional regulator
MKLKVAAESFESLFPKVRRALHSCGRPAAGGGRQASLLEHLDPLLPAYPAALARHLGITPSTVSLTVDRLVARGLALRERSTGDARRLGIRLTAEGARLRDAGGGLDADRVRGALRRLSPRRRRRVLRGLRILVRAIGSLPPGV